MKPEEVRIGNWIADRGGKEWIIDSWENPTKVASKPPEYYLPSFNMMSQFHPLTEEIDFLKPIPLTEEWLLKFGFEKIGLEYMNFSFKIDKWTQGEFMYGWIGGNVEIKHVHQLQGLYYALTGEELEIKII